MPVAFPVAPSVEPKVASKKHAPHHEPVLAPEPPMEWVDDRHDAVSTFSESANVPHIAPEYIQAHEWTSLVDKLHVRGLEKQLAQQSELLLFDEKIIELRCENRMLATSPIAVAGLEKRLNAYFTDQKRRLKVQLGSVVATPASEKAQARAVELEGAQKLVADDPTIHALIRELDGMLIPSSIQAT